MRIESIAMFLMVGFVGAVSAVPTGAKTLSGPADVVDGDTLSIEGEQLSLFGIEAFVLGQKCWGGGGEFDCGASAKKALEGAVATAPVTCALRAMRSRAPLVAVCRANGRNLSEEMIRRGWALVRPDLAGAGASGLCELEAQAKRFRQGAWPYTFALPFYHKGGRVVEGQVVSCGNERLIVP